MVFEFFFQAAAGIVFGAAIVIVPILLLCNKFNILSKFGRERS